MVPARLRRRASTSSLKVKVKCWLNDHLFLQQLKSCLCTVARGVRVSAPRELSEVEPRATLHHCDSSALYFIIGEFPKFSFFLSVSALFVFPVRLFLTSPGILPLGIKHWFLQPYMTQDQDWSEIRQKQGTRRNAFSSSRNHRAWKTVAQMRCKQYASVYAYGTIRMI